MDNLYKKIYDILVGIDIPIYICGHIRPDQDSICSCVALKEFLNSIGKNAKVLLKKEDIKEIEWLGDDDFTEKVPEPKYAFVMLDMNVSSRLGEFKQFFESAELTINIDHHEENAFEADATLSLPDMSSTCEIIYNIINVAGRSAFTKKIANCIYSGIFNDSHSFTKRLTDSTMSIAQNLVNMGVDYAKIIFNTYSKRSMYQMRALSKIIEEIKFDGVHYVVIDMQKDEYRQLTYNQIVKQIAEEIRCIEDIKIMFFFIKYTDRIVTKVTSISNITADKIASHFGGGGHKREAGFTVQSMDIEEIIKEVKCFLKDYLK